MLPKELKSKPFLSPKEVATILGISDETVYRLVRRGALKAVKLPGDKRAGKMLISLQALEELLEKSVLPVEGR